MTEEEKILDNFFNNVKRLRKERGLSRRALAKRAGISHYTIINIELKRAGIPSLVTIFKVARAFNLTIDEIISEDL